MKWVIVLGVLCSVIAGQYWLHGQDLKRVQALEDELAESQAIAASWKIAAEKAKQGNDALRQQAQSCLNREAAARADADHWQEMLEKMELRPMEEKERKGVPDDKTRDALLDDLDRPL